MRPRLRNEGCLNSFFLGCTVKGVVEISEAYIFLDGRKGCLLCCGFEERRHIIQQGVFSRRCLKESHPHFGLEGISPSGCGNSASGTFTFIFCWKNIWRSSCGTGYYPLTIVIHSINQSSLKDGIHRVLKTGIRHIPL